MDGSLYRRFAIRKLHHRLLLSFVLAALVPILAISATSIAIGYSNAQKQMYDRLQSVTLRKELEVTTWLNELHDDLIALSAEEYMLSRIQVVFDLSQDEKYLQYYNTVLQSRFQRRIEQTARLEEIMLLDLWRRIPISTRADRENTDADPRLLQPGRDIRPFTMLFTTAPTPDFQATMVGGTVQPIVAIPILDEAGAPLGFLAGSTTLSRLAEIFRDTSGIRATGQTYLAGGDAAIMADDSAAHELVANQSGVPVNPQRCNRSSGQTDAGTAVQSSPIQFSAVFAGSQVIGMCRWLPQLQLALFIHQNQTEAFSSIMTALRSTIWIALVGLLGAIGAALLTARTISAPISRLGWHRRRRRAWSGGV